MPYAQYKEQIEGVLDIFYFCDRFGWTIDYVKKLQSEQDVDYLNFKALCGGIATAENEKVKGTKNGSNKG